jgi:phenylacetic acid degradation operon negative regulatory protein
MVPRPRSTRGIVLELLSATRGRELGVKALARAASLFGVSDNNLRVTLARLKQDGLVEGVERGRYRLGPEAWAVAERVRAWRDADKSVKQWRGAWIGVHSAALPRVDRAATRRRDRALRLLGFRCLSQGLHLRPDNLRGSVPALRRRLVELGLEEEAPVFRMSCLDEETEAVAFALWDTEEMNETYRRMRRELERAERRLDRDEGDEVARDAFVLGGDAIRAIVFDPLLPNPIVDTQARGDFIEAMRRFDESGRRLWMRILREAEAAEDQARDGEESEGGVRA